MTVIVVMRSVPYEFDQVVGVCLSKDKGRELAQEWADINHSHRDKRLVWTFSPFNVEVTNECCGERFELHEHEIVE